MASRLGWPRLEPGQAAHSATRPSGTRSA